MALLDGSPASLDQMGLIAGLLNAKKGDNWGLLFQNAANQAQQRQRLAMQEQAQQMQMEQMRRAQEQAAKRQTAMGQLEQQHPQLAPLFQVAPDKAIDRAFPSPKMKFAPNGQAVDMNALQPGQNFAKPPDWKDPEYEAVQSRIRAAGRPQVNVNTREETEFAKKMGANYAEQYDGILKGGMGAQNKLRDMQRFENIVSKVPTGKLEPIKAEVAKLANGLGVKVDTEKLGFQEALESMANQYALTLRSPSGGAGMPGALSDKDREFLVNMVPGLAKTGTGNKIIIEGFRRVAQREIEIAALAREYKSKTGKFDDGFFAEVEKRFGGKDLLGDLYQQAASSGAQNVPMTNPGVRVYDPATGTFK
jgi:hypothetical protein